MDNDSDPITQKIRVHLHTNPAVGITFYDGHVDVWAVVDDDFRSAFEAACRRLGQTSFPGRGSTRWWVYERAEVLK
jgi:hypothetical protein